MITFQLIRIIKITSRLTYRCAIFYIKQHWFEWKLGTEQIPNHFALLSHYSNNYCVTGQKESVQIKNKIKIKPRNDLMYQDIYNCICQNTKKIRLIIHYVKPTAQLLFKIWFPKGGPTCRRQVVNPRHQTPQGQSVAKPETPLQMIEDPPKQIKPKGCLTHGTSQKLNIPNIAYPRDHFCLQICHTLN